jgi:hypothetical protein
VNILAAATVAFTVFRQLLLLVLVLLVLVLLVLLLLLPWC